MCLAARSIAPDQHWLTGLCLGSALRRVCTAPSPVLREFHGFSLADVLLRRKDGNLENSSSTCPRCCDCTAVYAIPGPCELFCYFRL